MVPGIDPRGIGYHRPMASRSPRRTPIAPAARATKTASRRRRVTPSRPRPAPADAPPDPVRAILDAAGALLDEHGMEGLNTTAVAARAGVSTATLYRHFPDKHAVLHALVHSLQEERAEEIVLTYRRVATEADWRTPLREATLAVYRMRLARPGGRSTRRALQTSSELWQWDVAQSREIAEVLARAMRRRRPSLTRAVAQRVALSAVTATAAMLDLACLDDRRGPSIVEEAIAMREAYLAPHLD